MWVADDNWVFSVSSMPRSGHDAPAAVDRLMQLNDDMHLVHTIQGRATLHTPHGVYESHPGVVMAIPVFETNHWQKKPGQPWRMLNFHLRIYDPRGRAMHERNLLPVSFSPRNLPAIHRQLDRWTKQWHTGDQYERMMAAGQVISLTGRYLQEHGLKDDLAETQPDELMMRARDKLGRQIDQPFDGPAVAEAHGLSVSQFTRRFKHATGMAPKAWVMRQRLAMAQSLLLETTLPIARIAAQLGFGDVYHFSKWFSRQTKSPPGEYRKQARQM